MGADSATTLAKHIWAWCRRQRGDVVTKHDIHRAMQCRVTHAADVEPALTVLVERSILRELLTIPPRRPGRPPSPKYEINPQAKR